MAFALSMGLTLCIGGVARGEEPGERSGSQADSGAVPRGAAGAVIVPPKRQLPADQQISLPKLVRYVEPVYPPRAVQAGIQGLVFLVLTIEKNGTVSNAVVQRGPGHGLNVAAQHAARQLGFEPAKTAQGVPVRAKIQFKYEFTLQQPPPAQLARPLGPPVLEGTVVAGAERAPIAGAEVVARTAPGGEWTVTTDDRGRFLLPELPPGPVRLTVTAAGFEPLVIEETLEPAELLEVRYRLRIAEGGSASAGAIDVYVEGERPSREVVRRRLERQQIDRIPGTRGDALRSVQSLPGVARPPGMAGMLIVRGSAPEDSQTFIDRMPVPLTYHFGGLSSVVPTELLQGIDFYPGNFSSRYGRIMGGVVDVGLRSPKDDGDYHGLAQIDFIDARLMFEGPIPLTDDWTFLAAGRRSYIDAWLGPMLENAGANVSQAPVYWDYQFMVEHQAAADTRMRLGVLGSDDGFALLAGDAGAGATGNFDFHTAFQRAQLYLDHQLPGGHRFDSSIAFARDVVDVDIGAFFLEIEGLSVYNRFEYSHRLAKSLKLDVGLDFNAGQAIVSLRQPVAPPPGEPANSPFVTAPTEEASYDRPVLRPGTYLELEATPVKRLRLVPGVRADYAVENDHFDLSPRFNARYELFDSFPNTAIKAGIGVYRQPPVFLEIIPPLGNPELESEFALHYGLGVEQDITRQIEVALDGYIKQLDNLVVGTASTGYTNEGSGTVFGGELMVKYKPDEHFFGWLAYTLSRSVRRDLPDGEEYLAPYDQTHNLTVVGSYKIGRGWEAGMRFRLTSGNLVTPAICDPEESGCDPNAINAIYHAPSATYLAFSPGGRNSERLPLSHQLDLRVDKTWTFEAWKLSWYLDIQNVYNWRADEGIIYNYNYTDRVYIEGLTIIPSMGLRGQF